MQVPLNRILSKYKIIPIIFYNYWTASYEYSIGLPSIGVGQKITIGAEMHYNVGSSSGKKTSKAETWEIKYPSKIPPRSQ